jgi:toxin ParE1/3/4
VLEAFDWYELQQDGLGAKFLSELDNFFFTLLKNPKAYSYYQKPVRSGMIQRFPYAVVFETIGETIIVYSVFMAKQDPVKKRTKSLLQ